ncbi:MAG: HAMP domain-containing histidine kinase [Bacteroidetes bacterium]|nr:HAMP domain-containing histidine kinase [Bacteroidota bacterium]
MQRRPVSANFKIALVVMAILIVISVLFYTQSIVEKLQEREHESLQLHISALEYIANDSSPNGDYTFETSVTDLIDFPILMTDASLNPYTAKNMDVDSSKLSAEELQQFHIEERDRMAEINPPIVVTFEDSTILGYLFYDESDLVKELRALPYIEILVASMFILIGYIGFSYIKRSEQANIWVGMSKETAHQLGTPLSSMLGWLELLHEQTDDPEALRQTIAEMEKDVNRLNRIALRFSKIGSKPQLVEQNLMETIRKSADYYRRRTPQLGKKVAIIVPDTESVNARYNAELLEWVFENLMKNALDAMEHNDGRIEFFVSHRGKKVIIDVQDNGKGIDLRLKKDIFRPGYSTKKRGWGLGLSLARRIVQDYHSGKLFVHDTAPGKGTTFRIILPA